MSEIVVKRGGCQADTCIAYWWDEWGDYAVCNARSIRGDKDTECPGPGEKGCPLNDGPITVRLEEI